jgi:hypothetical protein
MDDLVDAVSNLVGATTDLQARLIRMESAQTGQTTRLNTIDERVSKVESTERAFPWKVLGIVGAAVSLLLIPTVGTLITVGRRDEVVEQTVTTLREVRDDIAEIGQNVEALAREGVSREERIRAQQQRIERLEQESREAASVRQDSRHR